MNHTNLFNSIKETVLTIDNDLKLLTKDKGIFFAPELYTAFSIGKDITKNCHNIFNTSADWLRETNFGNGGPTDIIFISGDIYLAIELKLRDTIEI